MRHTYQCPLRWADLDLLGHVNNVVYVDYLQEARVDMLRTHAPDSRADDLAEGVVVVRHDVTYRAPLTYRLRPVSVDSWVSEVRAATFTLAHEIYDEDESGERTVYLTATSVLTPYVFAEERPRRLRTEEHDALARFLEDDQGVGPRSSERSADTDVRRTETGHFPVHVRFSDLDVYGHVNNVKYFEYLQEARIPLIARLGRDVGNAASDVRMVVAQTDVDYRAPILHREQPYDSWTWLSHLGRTSLAFETAICDGDRVLARARVVGVFWDPDTGRPVPPPADFQEALATAMG